MDAVHWLASKLNLELTELRAMESAAANAEDNPMTDAYRAATVSRHRQLVADRVIFNLHSGTHTCVIATGAACRATPQFPCSTLMALVHKRAEADGFDPAWA